SPAAAVIAFVFAVTSPLLTSISLLQPGPHGCLQRLDIRRGRLPGRLQRSPGRLRRLPMKNNHSPGRNRVGVEMTITDHPLHRSGQAGLPHPAPTLGDDAKALERIKVTDIGGRKPTIDQPIHAFPSQPLSFTPTPKREVPVTADLEPEALDRRAV